LVIGETIPVVTNTLQLFPYQGLRNHFVRRHCYRDVSRTHIHEHHVADLGVQGDIRKRWK